jgi:hypothetical protein
MLLLKEYKIINYLTFEEIFNKHNINKNLIMNIYKYSSPRFKVNEICNLSWSYRKNNGVFTKIKIFDIFYKNYNKSSQYLYSFNYFNCYGGAFCKWARDEDLFKI